MHCPPGYYRCQNGQCVKDITVYWLDEKSWQESDGNKKEPKGRYLNALAHGCRDRSNIFPSSIYPKDLFCQNADKNETSSGYCNYAKFVKKSDMQNDEPADQSDDDDEDSSEKETRKLVTCKPGLESQCKNTSGDQICAKICDGVLECADESDEINCESCADESEFRCLDGECIGMSSI